MDIETPDFQNRERYVPLGNGWYYDLESLPNVYVTVEAIGDGGLDRTIKMEKADCECTTAGFVPTDMPPDGKQKTPLP